MSFKKTLIFLIILALLGGYYYLFEVRGAKKKEAAEQAEKQLFDIAEEDIQEISMTRQDEEILLKKQDDTWKILQPVADTVDEQAVNNLVSQFVEAERAQTITDKASNDADFGLDTPELVVLMKGAQEEQAFMLSFGSETPVGSEFYTRVGDEPAVITVSSGLKTNLDKTLYDLRDKTILDFDSTQIKQAVFTIKNPDTELRETITLTQTDDVWDITTPKEFKADTAKMEALLSKIKNSQVKAFVAEAPEDLARYGLAQPDIQLMLVVGDDNTQETLLLGAADEEENGIYAKHEAGENVFLVPMDLIGEFPESINDLRDKALLSYDNDNVQKIELVSGDETIVLDLEQPAAEDTESLWKIVQPGELKADTAKIRTWLWDVQDVTVEQFVTDEPADLSLYGLEPPQLHLSVWLEDQEQPQQLLLGNSNAENTGIYAKLGTNDQVVLVNTEVLEKLKKTTFDLRYTKFVEFDRDQVEKLQITYPESTLLLEKKGDTWKAREPEKLDLTTYKVTNLLYDLSDLDYTGEILAPEADLSVYGLDVPAVEVTLWEKDREEGYTLLIGKVSEGETEKLYVKVATAAPVYEVDSVFLEEIPKEVKDLSE